MTNIDMPTVSTPSICKVKRLISKYRENISFSANEEIHNKLKELSSNIAKLSGSNGRTEALAIEIESLANTVFMPSDII